MYHSFQALVTHNCQNCKEIYFLDNTEKIDYLHILMEGHVRLYKTTPTGKEVYLNSMTAPSPLALLPALERVAFPAHCGATASGETAQMFREFRFLFIYDKSNHKKNEAT